MTDRTPTHREGPITGSGSVPFDVRSGDDPLELFQGWFADAERAGVEMPEAVALATATADGVPSVRMVLLKGADADGFTFFTNYESRKAGELEQNPRAALCFHWKELDRQVRVTGTVARVSEAESLAYFRSRPAGSRVGAWASRQSRPLTSRDELLAQVDAVRARFAGADVPLPPFWGGYRVRPERIEFWQGRPDRLHDRFAFDRVDGGWTVVRLYP